MRLPENISQAVASSRRRSLQVKSFIFALEAVESGEADDTVNAFCAIHNTSGIVLDRHNSKMIYRVIYRKE